ncbi:ThiF family adenylyltransferase [Solwaraspora sp. WMMB762]|uniref:ThiF family adenylyltransferase n=1 Tax=Solwaraspora sp. WMMB762 TaxID=3404120 RepID=UPI003B9447D8
MRTQAVLSIAAAPASAALSNADAITTASTDSYDRPMRGVGPHTQHRLAELTVAVVGLGGVGSQVVQSLAHLGVGGLLLVDPDTVTATNLNRLVGAKPADVRGRRPRSPSRLARSGPSTRRYGYAASPAASSTRSSGSRCARPR